MTDLEQVDEVLKAICPGVLIRWVVIMDALDTEDNRILTRLQPDSSTWWEGDGMLAHALQLEQEEGEEED